MNSFVFSVLKIQGQTDSVLAQTKNSCYYPDKYIQTRHLKNTIV
jgi:hypothetical protein